MKISKLASSPFLAVIFGILFVMLASSCSPSNPTNTIPTQHIETDPTHAAGGTESATLPPTATASHTPEPTATAPPPTEAPTLPPAPTSTITPLPSPTQTPQPSNTQTSTPPPAATAPALNRSLYLQSPRMSGEDVRAMQARLLILGYSEIGTADGIFGPATDRVVRQFQSANGLDADGVVGPKTWSVLFGTATPTPGPAATPTLEVVFGKKYEVAWTLAYQPPCESAPNINLIYVNSQMWVTCNGLIALHPRTLQTIKTISQESFVNLFAFDSSIGYPGIGYRGYLPKQGSQPEGAYIQLMRTDTNEVFFKYFIKDTGYDPLDVLGLSFDGKRVWVGVEQGKLLAIDIQTKTIVQRIAIGENWVKPVYFDGKLIWAGHFSELFGIDPQSGAILRKFDTNSWNMVSDGQWLWGNFYGELRAIDPQTGEIKVSIPGAPEILSIAFDGELLWLTTRDLPVIFTVKIK